MPSPFRLAAIDIDDTLLGPEKTVSAANRSALQRLQRAGCRVILASGRRHANMVRWYRELELDDFAVSCQGARAQHATTGESLHLACVAAARAREVIAAGRAAGFSVVVWSPQGIFATDATPWSKAYDDQTGGDPVSIDGNAARLASEIEKLVWVGEPARLQAAGPSARARFGPSLALTEAHDWCLEFSHPEATKAAGIAAVARAAGIGREAVVAFGDGYNDVPLLRWAGLGIAMAHGRDSARQAAHRVSPAGEAGEAFARAVAEVLAGDEPGRP